MANLEATLKLDMNRIWDSLKKPEIFTKVGIEEVFQFEFAFLPHKILKSDEFLQGTKRLAKKFLDPEDPEGLLKKKSEKIVPSDGLAFYAQAIWDKILNNKDLDLPSQQELLAQYRCDEISSISFQKFIKNSEIHASTIGNGKIVDSFAKKFSTLQSSCLEDFDNHANRYSESVFQRKYEDLKIKIEEYIHSIFLEQLSLINSESLQLFDSELKERLGKEKSPTARSYRLCLEDALEQALNFFVSNAQSICSHIKNYILTILASVLSEWKYEKHQNELLCVLGKKVLAAKKIELAGRIKSILVEFRTKFSESLSNIFSDPGDNFPRDILSEYEELKEEAEELLKIDMTGVPSLFW